MRYVWHTIPNKMRDGMTGLERAHESLEDDYATGTISSGERPRIETVRDHRGRITHYQITLEG